MMIPLVQPTVSFITRSKPAYFAELMTNTSISSLKSQQAVLSSATLKEQ